MADIAFPASPANNDTHSEAGRTWQYDSSINAWLVVAETTNVLTTADRIDEDDMFSNSATKVPTQQSVKAYVDAEVSASGVTSVNALGPGAVVLDADDIDDANTVNKFVTATQAARIGIHVLEYALSDETTSITTGTAKLTVRAPWAFTLTAVRASLATASSSGTPTIDINKNDSTVLSTKLTIDANEKTSATAATPAVISVSSFADDDQITFDIDTAGTGAKGLKVKLYVTRP